MTNQPPTPATAALRQAAQAARDAALAGRLDDLAARLRHEARQLEGDVARVRYADLLEDAAQACQATATGLRALAAGDQ